MKLLLGSHGQMASGIKSSLQVLVGTDAEKITVIDAYTEGVSIDKELEEFFSALDDSEEVLMLSDLYGGSVNQKMYLYLERPNTYLIAGVNLALVIELLLKEELDKETILDVIDQAKNAMVLVEYDNDTIAQDEDFL